ALKQRRPGESSPIGKTAGAESEIFRLQFRLDLREIRDLLRHLSPPAATAGTFAADHSAERKVARRRKAVQCRSRFSESTRTVVNTRRCMRPEWKAAQMAKIVSKRSDRPARIGMCQSMQRGY